MTLFRLIPSRGVSSDGRRAEPRHEESKSRCILCRSEVGITVPQQEQATTRAILVANPSSCFGPGTRMRNHPYLDASSCSQCCREPSPNLLADRSWSLCHATRDLVSPEMRTSARISDQAAPKVDHVSTLHDDYCRPFWNIMRVDLSKQNRRRSQPMPLSSSSAAVSATRE
ncbi:uncharacterized protein LY89DRAFT_433118 [Mollisia scopiformis]|uniref:Uncharacterized protein n=1 Tax=Mollisia scopiformis TaxID=149040 RepID=A0A194XMQ9_MOLSC|nr:uncharacterized protein LY89DRAFT_433118 [Mollisia scopiformis]KUJ21416.1 hypothetical protein LY89DRAFT_433118 [Mollisia scopiformis]